MYAISRLPLARALDKVRGAVPLRRAPQRDSRLGPHCELKRIAIWIGYRAAIHRARLYKLPRGGSAEVLGRLRATHLRTRATRDQIDGLAAPSLSLSPVPL